MKKAIIHSLSRSMNAKRWHVDAKIKKEMENRCEKDGNKDRDGKSAAVTSERAKKVYEFASISLIEYYFQISILFSSFIFAYMHISRNPIPRAKEVNKFSDCTIIHD